MAGISNRINKAAFESLCSLIQITSAH